jgi:hypothetical protein
MSNVYAWYFCGAAVVGIAIMSVLSAVTSRGYRFSSGRVQGVTGVMGSGKSLFIVTRVVLPAARTMSKKRGLSCAHTFRPVQRFITNFAMDLPYPDAEVIVLDGNRLWDHLLELAVEFQPDGSPRLDAIVIIDEAHFFLPSAKQKMAAKASYFCSMARKLNCEVWWVTQDQMKVHKRLRDDSDTIWQVGRNGSLWTLLAGPSSWFVARAYKPSDINRANPQALDQRRYRLSKTAIACYNSFDLIVPDAEVDVSLDDLSARRSERLTLEKETRDTAINVAHVAVPLAVGHESTI